MTGEINYIFEYYKAITDGRVKVGKWIKRIYEILVNGINSGEYIYSPKKADRAIRFIENFCRHSEGQNSLLKLELWEKAIVAAVFGILDKDTGYRQFREVFIVIARKNGKTILAAAIIAYMAYGDGEYGAKIYCLAPKLEQADLVYDAFYQMIQKDPDLSDPQLTKKRRSDIYIAESNTSIKKIAFNSKKSDGFNPHLVVNDELAAWSGEQGLKQYEVMKSALGARKQPLMLSITTSGYVDNGIYDELVNRSTAFLAGGDEERLLPFLYMIDDEDNWCDLEELKKSNPNLGVSVFDDFYKEEIKIAKSSLSKRAEFKCKYCNLKQNSSVAWLMRSDIEKISKGNISLADFKGCYCLGGVDLSQTTDLTAASVIIERKEIIYVFTQFFMPEARIDTAAEEDHIPYRAFVEKGILTPSGENFVDYRDVYEWFVNLRKEYKLLPLQIGYDRYSSQYLVQDLKNTGFHVDDVYQGTNLSPVLHEFEGLVKDGKIQIGQNALLQAHMLNVAVQMNLGDRRIKPVKLNPRAHIDGFMSVIDAFTVRSKYYSQIGKYLKNERRN